MFHRIRSNRTSPVVSLVLATLFLSWLFSPHTASARESTEAAPATGACAGAARVDPNATVRIATSGEVEILRLELPSAGIVEIDLASAEPERSSARVDLWQGCGPARRRATVLGHSPSHLVLAVYGGGTWWLRAGTEHEGEALGRQKLTSRFLAAEVIEDVLRPAEDGGPSALGGEIVRSRFVAVGTSVKGDPEETDPDPDAVTRPAQLLASVLGSRLAVKGDPEETDPDPDAKIGPAARAGAEQVLFDAGACPARRGFGGYESEDRDDHGDTPRCATPLALENGRIDPAGTFRRATGVIGNARGDDVDVFTFTLERFARLEVLTTGETDTFLVLADGSGRRAAMDDDSGDARNARLVRTLAPGRYFVRVTGAASAEGAYTVAVRSSVE